MKKGLIGLVIVSFVLVFTAGAMAKVEISNTGSIQFKVSGGEGTATLFGKGDVLVDYHVTATSGPWTAVVSPEFDIGGGALGECDAYMTYSGGAFTLTLDPTGIDNGIFDLYSVTADGSPNIPSNPGFKVAVPMGSNSFYGVVNTREDSTDPTSTVFEFGGGASLTAGPATIDLALNSAGDKGDTWYGSSYGAKLTYGAGPITVIGEYGAFSPSKSGLKSGSGYYGEFDYAIAGGGTLKASYTGSDKNLNGAGTATDHAYSKIYGEFDYPIAEAVTLTFDVTSEDTGLAGAKSKSSYEAKVGFSF